MGWQLACTVSTSFGKNIAAPEKEKPTAMLPQVFVSWAAVVSKSPVPVTLTPLPWKHGHARHAGNVLTMAHDSATSV